MTAGRTLNTLSQDWGTPQKYVNAVREFFGGHIALDPCSNEHSIVQAQTDTGSRNMTVLQKAGISQRSTSIPHTE